MSIQENTKIRIDSKKGFVIASGGVAIPRKPKVQKMVQKKTQKKKDPYAGIVPPCVISNLDIVDYHNHDSLSSTGLSLCARSLRHYYDARLAPDREIKTTKPLTFGQAVHSALLEDAAFFARKFLIAPDIDKRTGVGKQIWRELETQAAAYGQQIITQIEYERLVGVVAGVRRAAGYKALQQFADSILAEHSFFFPVETQAGEIVGRCRPDLYCEEIKTIFDLKTTEDARCEPFTRSIVRYGYHIAAAWYLDGVSAVAGEAQSSYIFIAAEKKRPYEVAFYEIGPEALAAGRQEYKRIVELYALARKSGRWDGYASDIRQIGLPQWYKPADPLITEESNDE